MTTQNEVISKPLKQYTGVAARILKLLSSGSCSQEQAAKAVGVDASYVSQLSAEEDFQLQVAEAIKKGLEQAVVIDENYGEIEKVLSKKLTELAPWMMAPDQILRTLKFVNEAKRKTQTGTPTKPNGSNGSDGTGTVRLQLPSVIIQNFVVNPNNEIVGIGNRELVTLNSNSMTKLVKARKEIPKLIESKEVKINGSKDKWSDL